MGSTQKELRDAIVQALREAVERAPGNRGAAVVRAWDEVLRLLARSGAWLASVDPAPMAHGWQPRGAPSRMVRSF